MSSAEACVLVTGGAGYVGSHAVKCLRQAGERLVVLDNLSQGNRSAVDPGIPFYKGDVGDGELARLIFSRHRIEAVLHFAALTAVGDSVDHPLEFYRNNVSRPLTLLETARDHGCLRFVFSSTCATYGDPQFLPLTEDHPQNPVNPYGQSKVVWERILADCESAFSLRHVSLRYFNACGCSLDGTIGEERHPETHLIPMVLRAARGDRAGITVFGTDYDTPDGTCIRDYIHVDDLASAHGAALRYLRGDGPSVACNLGTGKGVSVREIVRCAEAVTGRAIPVDFGARRPGDAAELVADSSRAKEILGWEARHTDVRTGIETHWRWMNRNDAVAPTGR